MFGHAKSSLFPPFPARIVSVCRCVNVMGGGQW